MEDELAESLRIALGDNLEQACRDIAFMSSDLCAFCVLRFLNYQSITLFCQPQNIIEQVLRLLCPSAYFPTVCSVCDGIMSTLSAPEFKNEILSFIQNCGFEYNQYLLNVTTPPFYTLVDAVYKHKLTNAGIKPFFATELKYAKKPSKSASSFVQTMSAVIPLKKASKYALGPFLTSELGVPVHYLSYFRCEIEVFSSKCVNWSEQQLKSLPKALRRNRALNRAYVDRSSDFGLDGEIQRILSVNGWNLDMLYYMCKNANSEAQIEIKKQIGRDPIYIAGRYLKLQRGIAQTGTAKVADPDDDSGIINNIYENYENESSDSDNIFKLPYAINNILEPLFRKYVDFDKFVFHAAGREDIDVRMLGNGRPFICELYMARNGCSRDWAEIGRLIDLELAQSGYISIYYYQLKLYEKHDDALMRHLYAGAQEKVKNYRALCASESEVPRLRMEGIHVKQKTPIRVLHRRALKERDKEVFYLEIVETYGNFFVCDIRASAGCYIKEFVHGDFGRTRPNLRQILGCRCEIMQLDVVGVEMQWPPDDVEDWVERIAPK